MKKGTKIFLGTTGVILAIAICFGCIGIYLKHEQNKPVFEPPQIDPLPSVTALPTEGADAVSYVNALYEKAIRSDDVEGDWHTDAHPGEIKTPFAEADNAIVQYIREQAPGQLSSFYPQASELVMSETQDAPRFSLDEGKVLSDQGRQGEKNEETDESRFYFLDFVMTPDEADMEAIKQGNVYGKIAETLSPAMTIEELEIVPESETVNCRIDRISDDLQSVRITKNYRIKATIRLTETYAPLFENETADVELPYETVESINFHRYGLHFLERQMATREDDMKALPLSVTVHSTATKEDYTLTFDISDPEAVSVDETGVLRVHAAREEAVEITATLVYDGHTYTDTIMIYATELEVKSDV